MAELAPLFWENLCGAVIRRRFMAKSKVGPIARCGRKTGNSETPLSDAPTRAARKMRERQSETGSRCYFAFFRY
jgi:hypothetical protein